MVADKTIHFCSTSMDAFFKIDSFLKFLKSLHLLYFYSLGPTLPFYAIVFDRYPFFKPWYARVNDPFLTQKGEKIFFGPQGAFLCRKNGVVGVAFSAEYVCQAFIHDYE